MPLIPIYLRPRLGDPCSHSCHFDPPGEPVGHVRADRRPEGEDAMALVLAARGGETGLEWVPGGA